MRDKDRYSSAHSENEISGVCDEKYWPALGSIWKKSWNQASLFISGSLESGRSLLFLTPIGAFWSMVCSLMSTCITEIMQPVV